MGSKQLLMLEAAPDDLQSKWIGSISDEFIDALPYIDHDYADPKVKAELMQKKSSSSKLYSAASAYI
ncbi:hypothetical protein SUGI_0453460 [Cryptomeria japonica]|nr:hypothetical protein SUGI_0453460 [Cryptomeria japonica]